MAAITLPAPGTEYGPCTEPCAHRDCAETRTWAARLCTYCQQPLGYSQPVYHGCHSLCLEEAAERGTLRPEDS